ncbi:MAG: nuclear transport factor 2 family protein, partial [Acidimicrobiia bacterium]
MKRRTSSLFCSIDPIACSLLRNSSPTDHASVTRYGRVGHQFGGRNMTNDDEHAALIDAEVVAGELEALRVLKARYFRLMDLKQWDEWADVFTEDCWAQYFPD